MSQISDTQAVILSAAARRTDRVAMPLPDSLRSGAAAKVVGAMIAKGLLQEVDANLRRGEPVWRKTGDGHGTTLVATDAGLAAIGIDPEEDGRVAEVQGQKAVAMDMGLTPAEANMLIEAPAKAAPKRRAALDPISAEVQVPALAKKQRAKEAEGTGGQKREGTKQAIMIEMLRAPEGTTIAAIMEKNGWQAHTVRGAFAGALKKAGLNVTSEKIEGRGRVYRIAGDAS